MADPMKNRAAGPDSPAWDAAEVAPHDDNNLPRTATRALYIGTGGDVEVIMSGATAAIVFAAVPSGTILPIRVDRVLAINTTADDIIALY